MVTMKRSIALGATLAVAGLAATGVAAGQIVGGVTAAQPAAGHPANLLATGYSLTPVATGADPLENPKFIWKTYGYLDDNADPLSRTRTEPDQNTYLTTADNLGGPTTGYDYGRHFLIQGHENGSNKAYLTRINLDVTDPAHRITLLNAPVDATTTGITTIDGSTYDPFNGQMLFTQENGNAGGVVATPLKWGSTDIPALTKLDGSMGRAGYEGVHNDKLGNVYLVEDTGGSNVVDNGTATFVKQPNSFVYRFIPTVAGDLSAGKLQALQVIIDGTPSIFHAASTSPTAARDDALGESIRRLHSGETLTAKWVTIHDTSVDGTTAFDANAAAKAKGATPLKRPENGKFVPGSDFKSFVFTETGDTDTRGGDYPGAAARAAWGAFVRVDMPAAGSDDATVKTILLGDKTHNSFDNIAFLDKDTFLTTEDRGDTLHQQLNALDSVWSFDITKPYTEITGGGQRLVALGRDPEAESKGNNEPTGIFVSDGATGQNGILGTGDPGRQAGVRMFLTQQHGLNTTYEITPGRANGNVAVDGGVGGTVPATLALTLGVPATFGAFTPGIALDYTAQTTANVTSTAGDAALSVSDPSATATGHLVNGSFSLPSALQAKATSPAGRGSAFAGVGGTLLTYSAPASNDPVALTFLQHIGAGDALRTGSYAKTLTFTLSTTNP
jgi:hypothetical protein